MKIAGRGVSILEGDVERRRWSKDFIKTIKLEGKKSTLSASTNTYRVLSFFEIVIRVQRQ